MRKNFVEYVFYRIKKKKKIDLVGRVGVCYYVYAGRL